MFKTPMSFSPRVTGDQARPSPSRFELWKEQLGLDGNSFMDKEIYTGHEIKFIFS